MTLVVVTEVELARGRTLLTATDSMLGSGYRWPRGPKLFPLGAACAVAFEGDTEVAYPLLINARNFISLSDHLKKGDAEPKAIFARVQLDVSEAYSHLVRSNYFQPTDARCSLVLAGWSWRLQTPVVWVLEAPPCGAPPDTQWSKTDVVAGEDWKEHRTYFAGNGDREPVATAWSSLKQQPNVDRAGYVAFHERVLDRAETSIGGAPQVMLLGPRVRETVGTRDQDDRRFLLGHRIASGAEHVAYYDESLGDLA